MHDLTTLGMYWRASWRYRGWCWIVLMAVALGTAVDFIVPLIVSEVLNDLAEGSRPLSDFAIPLAIAAVVSILGIFLWRIAIKSVWKLQMNVRRDLAERVFNHLARQSEQFHLDNFGGALVADSTKFLSGSERLSDEFVFNWYTTVLSFVLVIGLLAWRMPIFVGSLIVLSLIYVIVAWRTRMRELPYSRAVAASHSRQTGQLADTITNMSTVRSFGNEHIEDDLFEERTDRYVADEDQLMQRSVRNHSLLDSINRLVLLVAITVSIISVVEWGQPVGSILLVVTYTQMVLRSLRQTQRSMQQAVRTLGDARAMVRVLHLEPTVRDIARPEPLEITRGEVRLDKVQFSYLPRHPLFEDFDLHIEPGQRVGLVGASGSGKTTLSKLLLRFVDVQGGRILIDGHDISRVRQTDLRQQVTYVPQEPLLFHRSIRSNIAYGDPDASEAAIHQAAQLARADEFIERLPQGYETLVGERGTKLSGGQRQRIAIARAFLKRTPLLILDEATSALDSYSEALIQEALQELMREQTAMVIAHRLSTVSGLDRIVVMAHGRVVEDGSHSELLRQGGRYADLWNRQSGGFLAGTPGKPRPVDPTHG